MAEILISVEAFPGFPSFSSLVSPRRQPITWKEKERGHGNEIGVNRERWRHQRAFAPVLRPRDRDRAISAFKVRYLAGGDGYGDDAGQGTRLRSEYYWAWVPPRSYYRERPLSVFWFYFFLLPLPVIVRAHYPSGWTWTIFSVRLVTRLNIKTGTSWIMHQDKLSTYAFIS